MSGKERKRNSWQGNCLSKGKGAGVLQKLAHGEHRKPTVSWEKVGAKGWKAGFEFHMGGGGFECYPQGNREPQMIKWILERLLCQVGWRLGKELAGSSHSPECT